MAGHDATQQRAKSGHTGGGLSPADKGLSFQKRWTFYLALLAHSAGMDFTIGFELPDAKAGQFDDIFLQIGDSLYFIQIKHSSLNRKVFKTQFTEQAKKGGSNPWLLEKYCKAWPKISDSENDLTFGNTANVYCILLTNAPFADCCKDLFEAISNNTTINKESVNFINLINDNQVESKGKFHCLKESYQQMENLKQLDRNFVDHFILITEQPSLEELSDRIVKKLKNEFRENAESVFYLIESELNRLFHMENKLGILRNKQWLEELFEKCRTKSYLNFFNIMFDDIVLSYSNVKLKSRTALHEGTIVVLPYEKSYLLRMIQAKQMVGEDDLWYVPLESLEQRGGDLRNRVLQALKRCETSRVLILLDNAENEALVSEALSELSEKIKKVVVITKRDMQELKGHLNATWNIQVDATKITLKDLEACEEYCSCEVLFQGITVEVNKLPSVEIFKAELCEDSLIVLIRTKTLTIGKGLVNSEFKNCHYASRKLALIGFEVEGLKPEDLDHNRGGPYLEHNRVLEYVETIKNLGFVHVVEQTDDTKWKWCYTLPKCNEVIPAFNKINPNLDERSELEDETARNINKVFKMIMNNVRLCYGSQDNALDELQFVELLNVEDHERVVIIGGETGAGKSTTMRRLAELHKEKFPEKWVIFLNLCGIQFDQHERATEETLVEWIKQLLREEIKDKDQSFVERYFERCPPSDVVVYLDSFDEICASHIKKAFDIIRMLIEMKVFRIVISSRQYQEFLLFNEWPKSKVYHLTPLSFDDQLDMLQKILQSEGKPLPEETVKILQNLQGSKLGASQIVHMLAQIVKDNTGRTFAATRFTIFDLYKKYISCYIKKVSLEKLNLDTQSSNIHHADFKGRKQDFYKTLGISSMQKKLSANVFKQVIRTTLREDFSKQNLEYSTMNGLVYPNLKHRSFEDFFFARAMHGEFVDIEFDKFWKYFKYWIGENELVRLFFFHKVSKKLIKMDEIDDNVEEDKIEDKKEYKGNVLKLFKKIYSEKEIPHFSEDERKLPGFQTMLNQAITENA